jgi:hypothetical protein
MTDVFVLVAYGQVLVWYYVIPYTEYKDVVAKDGDINEYAADWKGGTHCCTSLKGFLAYIKKHDLRVREEGVGYIY